MPFDSFFKELVKSNNKGQEKILCFCRHPKKGQLILKPDKSHYPEGECDTNKACYKIQFDCERSISRNLRILTKISPKKRREWESRPTLDTFFTKSDLTRLKTDNELAGDKTEEDSEST
jgi:hypothetical protein